MDRDKEFQVHIPPAKHQNPNNSGQIESLHQFTDEELFSKYESGDQEAFVCLFQRYRKRIFHFILRFLRDTHASQDATQDLFLKIIKNPSRFQARSRFSTWLHAVAKNLCIDMLRKRKHRLAVSLNYPTPPHSRKPAGPPLLEKLQSPEPTPEKSAHNGSLRVKLLVALQSIPDEQRVVFLLREVGNLPFAEIAELLHISVNTAKSRMRYALCNLRKVLSKLGIRR